MIESNAKEPNGEAAKSRNRRRDLVYRAGMVLQVLGLGALAVLYPMGSPFFSAGIMVFELGVLIAVVFLLVWISWIKRLLLAAVLLGIPLQIAGLFAPPDHAGTIILCGIGLVCVGAAGMAGKEAYCFGWREGWVLMWSFPVVVLANIFLRVNPVVNSLLFSSVFLLLLWLTGRKLRQPMPSPFATNRCGPPTI